MDNSMYDPELWEIFKQFVGTKRTIIEDPIVAREGIEYNIADPVVYVYGGGLIAGKAADWKRMIENGHAQNDVQMFIVGYRLAPEFPFPQPMEDVYAAIKWLQANAELFNINPARIGLFSRGAALKARDGGLNPPLAKLMLVYPMLDDRTSWPSDHPLIPYLTWPVYLNDLGWKSYLGGRGGEQRGSDVSIYAVPGRAEDLSGLPPTYVDVGGLDLFLAESVAFVES
ncbi:Alpha/Beta hydrolase protein [Xylariales sp. PMI_506]|nr:Alpha/Beta hydrolase protein [Xylariales sp. PMI_506]